MLGQKPTIIFLNFTTMKTLKFVLMPSRHQHVDTDGLPSVFKETQDIFNLEITNEFWNFIVNADWHTGLEVFITGLTPALDKMLQIIRERNFTINDDYSNYNDIPVWLYHYDKGINGYRTV